MGLLIGRVYNDREGELVTVGITEVSNGLPVIALKPNPQNRAAMLSGTG